MTFKLSQNYPNPFNPSTTIEFSLPRPGYVTLKVFNILGEAIAALVNGELNVGTYTTQWNASGVASGIYSYRLQAGDPSAGSGQSFVDMKKLLLRNKHCPNQSPDNRWAFLFLNSHLSIS